MVRVSAIVSTFKGERFIRGCLEDLVGQTLFGRGEMEIVVIDSASPEGEGEIVREFQRAHCGLMTYVRTDQTETLYGAWNRGIKMARGEYVTNANVDDRHHPRGLEMLAAALDENKEIALVYGDSDVTDEDNAGFAAARRIGKLAWPDFERETLFERCYIGPHPMWRKKVHEEAGYFDDSREMNSAGDYEFWLRLSLTRKFLHVHETVGLYLENRQSIVLANVDQSWRQSEAARERHWRGEFGVHPKLKRAGRQMAALKGRMAKMPAGTRVAIYGAGKHTAGMIGLMREALEPHGVIAGILDDSPGGRKEIGGVAIFATTAWRELKAAVVVVSSDTYEATMAARIKDVMKEGGAEVWRIYGAGA